MGVPLYTIVSLKRLLNLTTLMSDTGKDAGNTGQIILKKCGNMSGKYM
jgi:hypothetical protein